MSHATGYGVVEGLPGNEEEKNVAKKTNISGVDLYKERKKVQ